MKHLNVVLMAAVVAISLPVVALGQSFEMGRDYRDDHWGRGDYYREEGRDRGSRGYDERRGGAVCAQEGGFCQFVVKLRFAMVPTGGTPSDGRETAYLATIKSSVIRLLAP